MGGLTAALCEPALEPRPEEEKQESDQRHDHETNNLV